MTGSADYLTGFLAMMVAGVPMLGALLLLALFNPATRRAR